MKFIVLALSLLVSNVALAQIVIVGSPSAPEINAAQAKRLFLGKIKTLPGAGSITVVERQTGDALKADFHAKVTGKSEAQLKSYWSKQVFTGKAKAPVEVDSAAMVKAQIANNPGAVGYIDSADVDASVKVLFTPN